MGFSDSWIAVKGLAPETIIEELALESVDERDAHRGIEIVVLCLANGWTVSWFTRDFEAAFKAPAVTLAQHGPAVACAVEEHVMFSEARGYVDGAETWRVTWDCEARAEAPAVSGDVPAAYVAISSAAIAEQAKDENQGVDMIWDVPADLAKSVCGFKHDEPFGSDTTVLRLRRTKRGRPAGERGASTGGGFLRRLFGGR